MATLEDAVRDDVLAPFELPDWERRLPIRQLWVAYEFWDWTDAPELHDAKLGSGRRTLFEHAEQTFCDFRCARVFPAGDLRQMIPNRHGVRKLHPPGLRIYGWSPAPHSFVAVVGALAIDTKKQKRLNDVKRDYVLEFICRNGLQKSVLKGDNRAVFPPQE